MNLLRGVGRLLLGGYFIINGAKAIKSPGEFAASAEPIRERFVPLLQRVVPPEASAYVPEDTTTLVRANGALAIVGGLGMATGIGRRGGAALAATSVLPQVLAFRPKGSTAEDRGVLVRNLALLGAALVVSQDTAGQPSLAWKAADARRRLSSEAERKASAAAKQAQRTKAQIKREARALKREAQLQTRLARQSIEGALS
ncbi:MAG: DoxX family membrane protein [Propioniciclava sp.]|uniref:DoxX family protein n=1 Tax=Propioniciclava sp. TaxID=2038686 RepID=UPI0039E4F331